MSGAQDRFMGEWDVTETIYSPQSTLLGTVKQRRQIFAQDQSETLVVEQNCQPSASLQGHPMELFSGLFTFQLQKEGRDRYYLGPDVEGIGMSFGDIFLSGEGVWPRFGANFRSWSIRISESRQLTGGVFFRGSSVLAVIFGVGILVGSEEKAIPQLMEHRIHGGQGLASMLDPRSDTELQRPMIRTLTGPSSWRETGPSLDETYVLEEGLGFKTLTKTCNLSGLVKSRGMAMVYGPILSWESHGRLGDRIQGLEITDPWSAKQYSVRQHFLKGQLTRIDGLQFSE